MSLITLEIIIVFLASGANDNRDVRDKACTFSINHILWSSAVKLHPNVEMSFCVFPQQWVTHMQFRELVGKLSSKRLSVLLRRAITFTAVRDMSTSHRLLAYEWNLPPSGQAQHLQVEAISILVIQNICLMFQYKTFVASNSKYCRQLIIPRCAFCLFWSIFHFVSHLRKLESFDILLHQSDKLHLQYCLTERLKVCRYTVHTGRPPSHPSPLSGQGFSSQDNMRPRRRGPARVWVREIVFPHLSFLPMNEALSEKEWDPYLPFGIAHVVTNQKQMSRQVALCSDCVC